MREAGDRTIGAVVLLEEDRSPHEGFAISTKPTWQRRNLSGSVYGICDRASLESTSKDRKDSQGLKADPIGAGVFIIVFHGHL
jgi:hypothetical protein